MAAHQTRLAAILIAPFLLVSCCGQRLDPLFGAGQGRDFFRLDRLTRELGQPVLDRVDAVGDLAVRSASPRLGLMLQNLPVDRKVRLVVWERSCRGKVLDRLVATFDPNTADIITIDGRFAYDITSQLK
jgi:hypothetical protein